MDAAMRLIALAAAAPPPVAAADADVAAGPLPKRSRLDQLAAARQVQTGRCEARKADAEAEKARDRAVLSLALPGCSQIAPNSAKSLDVKLEAMQKLAYSPRFRGSGSAIERVRGLQLLSSFRLLVLAVGSVCWF